MRSLRSVVLSTALLALASASVPLRLSAAGWTVTNASDGGAGSLRAALAAAAASGGDTVVFDLPTSDPGYSAATGAWTIALTSGPLLINRGVTISGPGADRLTISGGNALRVFSISPTSGTHQVTISGLTVANGRGPAGASVGGGIFCNAQVDPLTLLDCRFTGNAAERGAAILSTGKLAVSRCSFRSNTASGFSYGILSVDGTGNAAATAALTDCVFSGNTGHGIELDGAFNPSLTRCEITGNVGAGIAARLTNALVRNCVIRGNQPGGGVANFAGSLDFFDSVIQDTTDPRPAAASTTSPARSRSPAARSAAIRPSAPAAESSSREPPPTAPL